jgi:hypothetical protein
MKRFYVAKITETVEIDGVKRPVLPWDGLGVPARWVAFVNPADGSYIRPWVFAVVGGDQHATIEAHPNTIAMPDLSLDATLASLTATQRNWLRTKLEGLGIDVSGFTNATTIKQVLNTVLKMLRGKQDIVDFDVQDNV